MPSPSLRQRPSWAICFTGRTRTISQRSIKIEKQLTEVEDPIYSQRHVLALARYLDGDREPVMLKIRYGWSHMNFTILLWVQRDVDPDESDSDDEDVRDAAEVNFLYEVSAVDAVHEIGHGPKLLDYASQPQGPQLPWQEGWVDFIIMSRVPGENLMDVYQDLDDDQLRSVRFQIADILECMRRVGCILEQQDAQFFKYDEATGKVYLEDFTFMDPIDPSDMKEPILPDSLWVQAFSIWRPGDFGELDNPPSEEPRPVKNRETHTPTVGESSQLPIHNASGASASPSTRRAPPSASKESQPKKENGRLAEHMQKSAGPKQRSSRIKLAGR